MKCSKCGTNIIPGDSYCPGCGSPVGGLGKSTGMNPGFSEQNKEKQQNDADTHSITDIGSEDQKLLDEIKTFLDTEEPGLTSRSRVTTEPHSPVFDLSETLMNTEEEKTDYTDDYLKPEKDTSNDGRVYIPLSDKNKTDQTDHKKSNNNKIKKLIISAVLLILIGLLAFAHLSGFDQKFTEENAKELVKAELDAATTGTFDPETEYLTITEEDVKNQRKDSIDQSTEEIVRLFENQDFQVSDEQRKRISQMLDKTLKKSNYTVENVSRINDDSYSVTVKINPLDLYAGMDKVFITNLAKKIVKETPEIAKDRSLLYDAMLDGILDQIIDVTLENPKYKKEESVSVKVQENDEKHWIVNKDDLKKVDDHLIYTSEFLQDTVKNS